MSIRNIKQNQKVKVLLRLLDNNENIEIASSKAGLNIEIAKKYLSLN
jgi:hypothetical protein